ncbi:MAG: amino acid adenylation domain-containing protein, partial [bacterium]|nr:amino acid adenylation domain-containing protein [bacterium]
MTAKPDIEKIYSLSPMQEGMLYHALLDNQSQAYFEQSVFTINGPMDRGLLEKSFTRLIGRHPVLRTVFVHEKLKKPMQVVLKNVTPEPGFADISHLPAGEKENRLEAFKKEDREKGFDLVKGPPIRMLLIKTGERAYRLLLSFHHIIMDGWCLGIIFKDLIQIYHSLSQGKPVHLEPVTPYADYIKWLKQQDSEKGLSYWRKYLAGYEQQTSLPKARESHDYQPEEYGITLDGSLTGKITEIAEQHRLTVNTFFQALWGVLLQAYNNTGDVVFGAVVSGRPPEIKGIGHMVGLFINTVPVRVKTTGTATFSQLTRQMQEHSLLSKAYEYLPLAETQVNTAPGTHLIDHIMIFQNYPVQREIGLLSTLGEIGIEIRDIQFREQTNYDLNITIGPDTTGDTLTVRFEFNSLVYTRDFISGIAITFKEMVKQVVENFDTAVREIEIISDEEKKQVLFDFNNTSREFPKDKTMNQLFTAQAERTPEKIAVVGPLAGGGNIQFISFKELNRKSNQLAQLLMRKNLCPDSIVGIMVRRSIDMFIGILGILKAGGAYLPIDPGYPGERIRYMLKDSAAKMMVSSRYLAAEVENIFLEELSSSSQTPDLLPSQPQNTSNLAYIIYTSGTTGVPKGVAVEHRNVAANLFAFYREFEITQSDTVIQLNSFAFDAFIEEVFPVLLRGGKIAVPPATQMPDIRFLCNFITMHHVTIIDSTPLLLNELNHCTRLESVRIIISGGDILKKEYINHFLTSGKVYNTYGPTEATVCATYYRLPGEVGVTSNIPIGSPIANYKIYILAKNGALQPIGVPGELCIEGAGVTRGYLNSPQLTAEKFTTNPVTGQGVIYRSGDLARWLAGGNIEFLGRIDSQVKIRGYRIETGEIQSLLAKHEDINDAVVTAGADSRGEKYLCAYIVPHSPHSPHSPKLREYLSRSLPEYMVPSFFIEIEKIPLTSNGKLDKKALPGPGVPAGDSYVPPTDETQELLVGIWSEILGIEKNRIGIDTGFLDLGGHSLKAILLVSRIHKETDVKLPLAEIFAMSTIRRMAETIKNAAHEKHTAVEPAEEKAYYPPSPAQKRMYILNRMEPESTGYNITTVVQLEGALDMGRLEHGFLQLISRHESLRTSFPLIGDDPVQQVHTPGDVEFKIERGIPALLEEFVRPFDLSRAPLLRAAVLEIDARRRLLAMDTHHIVSDGVSAVLLVKDLVRFYEGEFLPPLTLQYKDYAQWLNRRKREGALEEQGAYWLKQFEGEIPVLNLPTDFARPTIQDFGGTHFSFELPRRETALLKAAALEEGTTLYVVLVAVFNILLSRLSGQEDIVVGTPTMGRRHADIQQIAGMFVNT